MSRNAKEIVRDFYESDFMHNTGVLKDYLHEDCQLHWNSSKGFTILGFKEIEALISETGKSYESIRGEISHLLEDDNFVTVRYTYVARTIEQPDKETAIAHFITIWEMKDGKMYHGYEMSQLADEDPKNIQSYTQIKV
ncbi:nuclear transport factor 2 family protein [Spongiivirga citrea]|uniref:Nuclear transport factor 2 family protein n=1 Tax=Spongiivirga citrea TaxID=1481457 RepID=A0A6M0CNT5_9FLAO|nr:nuclear transport factor 2 family protein [Spongiivirga citrea]NER15600.1 nuclear transport factor 2 family protein [Spongiivirga citrea]